MDAVQRLRMKAKNDGKLESNDKMKVETQVVEKETVVVIQQANPQVVYVPTYNPTVIWGPPPVYYPYPPVYYPPPPPPGAMLFSFGVGMAMGAAIHGGYCCGCGWGHGGGNTVVINNNNNFVNNSNRVNNISNSGNSNWQHNSSHRGGAPYGDRATQNKYGGSGSRGGSAQARPTASNMDRGGGAGSPGGNRGGAAGPSTMDRGGGAGAPESGLALVHGPGRWRRPDREPVGPGPEWRQRLRRVERRGHPRAGEQQPGCVEHAGATERRRRRKSRRGGGGRGGGGRR